jgi:hypothetical protein
MPPHQPIAPPAEPDQAAVHRSSRLESAAIVVRGGGPPRTITLMVSDQARPPLNKLVVPLSY